MQLVAGRLAHQSAARALAGWRVWLVGRRSGAARLQVALAAWRSCRLRAALSWWRQHFQDRQQQRALLEQAVRAMLGFRLRAAWQGWQHCVAERQEAAGKATVAVQRWQGSHLLKAFRSAASQPGCVHVPCLCCSLPAL